MGLAHTRAVTSRNPATGAVVAENAAASPADAALAVARAADAFETWSRLAADERSAILVRFAELVERDRERLTATVVTEMGKRWAEADGEVEWTAISARWYAANPPRAEERGAATVVRRPLGVVAAITPWNSPLITPAWKWLPALAAGNTVVWKPSELATATAVAAEQLWREAGLPADVLTVVAGDGEIGRALSLDPGVAVVHFTGSTETGRAVAAGAAARHARCVLELGGLNAVVVFADADLAAAADCIVGAAVAVNGQKCTSARRVLVERAVEGELVDRLRARFEALRLGDPADPATTLGPLITPPAAAAAEAELARALVGGAELLARAPAVAGDGLDESAFFRAALVAGLAPDDPLRRRELFAPVLAVEAFDRDEEAWARANATPYGLSAAVHTSSPARVETARDRLDVGVLAINRRCDTADLEAPFGGAKASGNGFPEGGAYAYAGVTLLKAVYADAPPRGATAAPADA